MAYKNTRRKILGRNVHDNQEGTTSTTNFICYSRRSTDIGRIRLRLARGWKFENWRSLHGQFIEWLGWTLRNCNSFKGRSSATKTTSCKTNKREIDWQMKKYDGSSIKFDWVKNYFHNSGNIFANICVILFIFFAFNYKDLHEVILEMHKMSLYKMRRQ